MTVWTHKGWFLSNDPPAVCDGCTTKTVAYSTQHAATHMHKTHTFTARQPNATSYPLIRAADLTNKRHANVITKDIQYYIE